jgi:hypothetical protein
LSKVKSHPDRRPEDQNSITARRLPTIDSNEGTCTERTQATVVERERKPTRNGNRIGTSASQQVQSSIGDIPTPSFVDPGNTD